MVLTIALALTTAVRGHEHGPHCFVDLLTVSWVYTSMPTVSIAINNNVDMGHMINAIQGNMASSCESISSSMHTCMLSHLAITCTA